MAIRERGGSFQVYWNNPFTGKRESKTFPTREEAEKEESLVKHRLKFERESSRKEESEKKVLTLENVYIAYLREKQFSRCTLIAHVSSMRPILRIIGTEPLENIGKEKLDSLKERMVLETRTSATARTRLSILRTVLRWGAEKGMLELPYFPHLPAARYKKFIPPAPHELAAMLEVAPPHIQRVIILGSQCGVRIGPSECFRLTWQDVDIPQRLLRVKGAKKNPGAPWREVPIRMSLLSLFEQWQTEDIISGASHLIHLNGRPVQSIKHAWATTLNRAALSRRIRPYDLRHAFATELIAAGTDIGTVAKLMGHSSPAMLLSHYQYVLDRQKKAAVESLPDLLHVPSPMCQKEKGSLLLQ